jgi:hypothetical protein
VGFLRKIFARQPDEPVARGPQARLMRECEKVSDEITAYLAGRQRKVPSADPTTRDNAAWHEAQNNHARYMMDTMSEYRDRFEARLQSLRDRLAEQGVGDTEFDRLVEHAGNPGGAQRAAEMLALLSRRLDPAVAALEKIYASGEAADIE